MTNTTNSRLAADLPKELLEILAIIDYSRITDKQYSEWIKVINENIGKHLKKRKKPAKLITVGIPMNQKLCDIVNEYDFNSIPFAKKIALMPAVKLWANKNLPLIKKLKQF